MNREPQICFFPELPETSQNILDSQKLIFYLLKIVVKKSTMKKGKKNKEIASGASSASSKSRGILEKIPLESNLFFDKISWRKKEG
jgi:hypothetical protein